MGLAITRDGDAADIVLELHHDRFTKYVYTAIDRRTNMVVASGKLSSLGGTVAGKVAKRFLKQVMQARGTAPKTSDEREFGVQVLACRLWKPSTQAKA